jgi:hypothetical protein
MMRRHVAEEDAKRAAPTAHWSIAHLPQRQLAHAWPFPVSVTDDGMVRNVVPIEVPKRQAKKKPRMDWCRGWTMNEHRVAAGLKPNRHQWAYDAYGEDTDRCLLCKRERGELWATGSAA